MLLLIDLAAGRNRLGMSALGPFKQRSRIMQPYANGRMLREHLNKRKISILVRAFDYVVEIADRLVRMQKKNELEFGHKVPRSRQSGYPDSQNKVPGSRIKFTNLQNVPLPIKKNGGPPEPPCPPEIH